jgi:hypothetical protein
MLRQALKWVNHLSFLHPLQSVLHSSSVHCIYQSARFSTEESRNMQTCCSFIHSFFHSFVYSTIHSILCLTIGPQTLPKLVLHRERSGASSFSFPYPVLSLRSPGSYLHLLPHLVFISILLCILPSIMCFRRQSVRRIWPIQLAFLLVLVCRIYSLSLFVLLLHFCHDRHNWSFPSFSSNTSILRHSFMLTK